MIDKKYFSDFIKKHGLFILLSLVYWLSRLFFLDTDFNVLEPDEALYYGFAKNLSRGVWPEFLGKKFLEVFPLYHVIAAFLLPYLEKWGQLISLRLLSALGSFLIGLSLYIYGYFSKRKQFGLWTSLIFWLIPLSFFYSRVGTMDMFALGWVFLGLILLLVSENPKIIFFSGALFALGLFSKSAMLIYFLSFLWTFLIYRKQQIIFFLGGWLFLILGIGIPYGFYVGSNMFQQGVSVPQKHLLPILNFRVHLANLLIYLDKMNYFLSWPIVILFLAGLMILVYKIIKNYSFFKKKLFYKQKINIDKDLKLLIDIVSLFLPGLVFIYLFDFSPRYYLLLLPGIAMISGLFFIKLPKLGKYLFVLSILPFVYMTFWSTQHIQIREINKKLRDLEKGYSYPIYSTIDPEKMTYMLDRPVLLLSPEATKGGIIITDTRKTELFANMTNPEFVQMKNVLDCFDERKLVWQYTDIYNHFPLSDKGNVFKIYLYIEE